VPGGLDDVRGGIDAAGLCVPRADLELKASLARSSANPQDIPEPPGIIVMVMGVPACVVGLVLARLALSTGVVWHEDAPGQYRIGRGGGIEDRTVSAAERKAMLDGLDSWVEPFRKSLRPGAWTSSSTRARPAARRRRTGPRYTRRLHRRAGAVGVEVKFMEGQGPVDEARAEANVDVG
jgi:hypothetical protein